jgi:NADPH2:quinone reductase
MVANLTLRFMFLPMVRPEMVRKAVEHVQAAIAASALTPLPIERFPLERAADAHDLVEAGAGARKVVIDLR